MKKAGPYQIPSFWLSIYAWILLLCLCSPLTKLSAQVTCTPVFIKQYDNSTSNIEPYAIKYLSDGSYVVAGKGSAQLNTNYDGMVMKLADNGQVQWSFLMGGAGDDAFTGILSLSNGDFLLYGSTSSVSPETKGWLVRLSGSGNVLWSKQISAGIQGTDRIKSVLELPDNNLVGTFNAKDSSIESNPAVFKIDPAGNLLWSHTVDNGNDDSFTSLAFDNGIIYAAGYYTNNVKRGVITQLNAEDGNLLSSKTIYRNDESLDEEVIDLEIYNQVVSYGLRAFNDEQQHDLVLVQHKTDGTSLFVRQITNFANPSSIKIKRSRDEGFFVLNSYAQSEIPRITKYNHYGLIEWVAQNSLNYDQMKSFALDATIDGGCITAGFYPSFNGNNVMKIARLNTSGYAGDCGYVRPLSSFTDTATYKSVEFVWKTNSSLNQLSEPASAGASVLPATVNTLCDSVFCTDKTPLPQGCGKTYRIEYAASKTSLFRDVITTIDGGRIAIGDLQNDALLVKFNINGDVAWSKNYQEYAHTMKFMRILRSDGDNVFVFANQEHEIDHTGYKDIAILKLDGNGNVIWSKNIDRYSIVQLLDVTTTPDNGFVMAINDGAGSGFLYSYAIRFDPSGAIVWQKEFNHSSFSALYKSVTCGQNSVYFAYDADGYVGADRFGVDKLDLSTGNLIWAKTFTIGNDNVERINRIFSVNDSAYVFINNFTPINPVMTILSTILVKLDPQGNISNTLSLNTGTIIPPTTYDTWDASPPTVAMSPSNDFVMVNRIADGADTTLHLIRFLKDGEKVWAHNFPNIKAHTAYNIHSQGNGFIVAGNVSTKNPLFNNNFLLKVDSSGQVIPNATGDCQVEDATLNIQSTTITSVSPETQGVTNLTNLKTESANMLSQDVFVDAVPYCNVSGSCGVVGFQQNGNGCSLTDTLVYYLQDPHNCDAAATWQYDASFFKPISSGTYAIKLLPLRSGIYTIKASIEGNCSYTEKNITASILLSASEMNLGEDTIICPGQNIRLSAGPGYKNYKWFDESTDSVITVTSPGKYFVTVMDNCGGSSSDTILVKEIGASFNLTDDTTKCNNDFVSLKASSGYINYQWFPQYNIQVAENIAVVSPDTTTLYHVQAELKPGCIVNDSVLVKVIHSPDIHLGNDTSICIGKSLLLNAGAGFDSYTWSTGETTQTINVNQSGSFYVSAYANGCSSADTLVIINMSPLPSFTLGNDTTLCHQQALKYNFNLSQASYQWSDGSGSNSKAFTQAGAYWLTVTQLGCAASDTVILTYKPSPIVNLGNDTTLCDGETKLLNAYNPNATYIWQDGSKNSDFLVSKPGLYFAAVTGNNCTAMDSINIAYKGVPSFSFGDDISVCKGMEVVLSPAVNGEATYLWQDGSTNSTFTVSSDGIYILKTLNECGSYADSVKIITQLCTLIMPSAFTPNNDGLNDIFRLKNIFPVKQFLFSIYNRWGQKVFETNDIKSGWSGYSNGIESPIGVYIWKITLIDSNDKKLDAHGSVTLIR
ncbi:MAG: gliding motility-associated C-terminal domain-containing protein [Agriterribacter sp.]